MRVFLGITGASGAPYAKGILDGLVSAGADVGVCASSAGIEVLATELYGDASLERDDVLARFTQGAAGVTVYAPDDWKRRRRSRRSTCAASRRWTTQAR